jgi:general secretion pathway protein L
MGRFVALAPGALAPLFRLDLPRGVSGAARLRVARRQLVDRLGPAAEALEIHPLPPADGSGQWNRLVAVARDTAERWRAEPAARHRRCVSLVPDYLAVPTAPGLAVVDCRDGVLRVRVGINDGFTAPSAVAVPLLRAALAKEHIDAVLLLGDLPAGIAEAVSAAGVQIFGTVEELGPSVAWPLSTGRSGLDLRQGEGSASEQLLGVWLLPLNVAIIALLVWSAGVLVETRRIEAQIRQVGDRTTETLREGLIPTGPILDIRAQVTRSLAEAIGGGANDPASLSVMDILHRAAKVAVQHHAEVRSVSQEAGDTLALTVVMADFEGVEALVSAFADTGLEARTQTARTLDAGGVESRISVTPQATEGTE